MGRQMQKRQVAIRERQILKKKKEIRFPNANLNSTDSSIVSNDLKAKKKSVAFFKREKCEKGGEGGGGRMNRIINHKMEFHGLRTNFARESFIFYFAAIVYY